MKKFLIISSFLMVMMSFSMIGYKMVSATEKVDEIEEQLEFQKKQEKYFSPYGYTLDNPNIIENPYATSPLTALILFETDYSTKVTVKILSKENLPLENTYSEDTKHIIPIYGLYPNTENKIEIITSKEKKTYHLKTKNIESFSSINEVDTSINKLTIEQKNNKLYGVDENKEIRWYYQNNVELPPYLLENDHLLLEVNNNYRHTLIEIDLLGKIYKQMNLEKKVTDIKEVNNILYLLEDDLIKLDWQTGKIIANYNLEDKYTSIESIKDDIVTLGNDSKESVLNMKTRIEKVTTTENKIIPHSLKMNYYQDNTNYKLTNGIIFQNNIKTPLSQKNILLVNYKKIDNTYNKYNVTLKKTKDTILLTGKFKKDEEVYLILDKFLDKRIYDIKSNTTIINQYGLEGKYSIYLKINNTIYKTNTYITI